MRSQQAKLAFSSGVLSPRLSIRADIEKYANALRQANNWIVTPQGGLVMREGLQNKAPASVLTEQNRIFQFHRGGTVSDYLVEVSAGDGLVHFYLDGVEQPDTVAHSYTLSQLDALNFTNQEHLAVIYHPDHPPFYIDIAVDGTITGEYLPANLIPPAAYDDKNAPTATVDGDAVYVIDFINGPTNNWNPSRKFTLKYGGIWAVTGQYNVAEYEFSSDSALCAKEVHRALTSIGALRGPDTRIIAVGGAFGTDFDTVEVTIKGPNRGETIEIFPANENADRYCNVTGEVLQIDIQEPAWSYPTYVFHNGNYYQCIAVHTPSDDNEPGVGVDWTDYWIDLGTTKPETYDYQYPETAKTGTVSVVSDQVTGVGTLFTEELSVEDWINIAGERVRVLSIEDDLNLDLEFIHTGASNVPYTEGGHLWTKNTLQYFPQGRGFPTLGIVHQQRLIHMANKGFTMGLFGSRINHYRDFLPGPQDDDPFFFAIDSSNTPTIKWAQAQRKLILGTSSGDFSVSAQVSLSPSDIQASRQNAARSNGSDAVTVNTDIFYIEQGREKIRGTGYSDDLQSQTSKDVSMLAEHLLDSRCKRLALMQTPEVLIFGLREDGSLLGISYVPEAGQGAWFEFETQGTIVDIATCYSTINEEDELWVTITYNGTDYYIEKMPYPKRVFTAATTEAGPFLVTQDLVCLDGWITGSLEIGHNNVISTTLNAPLLGQFEGLTVACIVNDSYTGEYLVADGAIILDEPPDSDVENYAGTYAIGMSYTATAETFEMSMGNPRGSALGTKRKWNKLYVKTYNSALPIINGTLPPDRPPETPMGVAAIIKEDLQEHEVRQAGWLDGSITIVQNRPYPTHLLGFFGEYNTNNA